MSAARQTGEYVPTEEASVGFLPARIFPERNIRANQAQDWLS